MDAGFAIPRNATRVRLLRRVRHRVYTAILMRRRIDARPSGQGRAG